MEYYETLVGDGESTTFYFTFPFFGVNDIHVKIDGAEQSTDTYTMTPNPTPNDADTEYTGGRIEFATPPAAGVEIIIYCEIELVRHIDYQATKKPESYQLNQDANQLMRAIRELKIKVLNLAGIADIPTAQEILAELVEIRNRMNTFLTADDLTEINNAITTIESAITTLAGYDYVIESQLPSASNNYTWYRKYKSGWVEQGGTKSASSTTYKSITLPITMSTTDYIINTTTFSGQTTEIRSGHVLTTSKSTTGFQFGWPAGSSAVSFDFTWEVKGIAAA